MARISPLSLIEPGAVIADDVEIGPFCHVGPQVAIAAGCKLASHISITGKVTLGPGNILSPNVVIGAPPQDRKYKGQPTRIEIGANNLLREAVTIHLGTERGGGVTRVGSNNMLMVNTHLGHDVQLGSNCILANNVMIAGHCVIGDFVAMMGGAALHHFVTIGEYVYVGGYARIHHDVPPFVKVDGADRVRGLNEIGLARAGVPRDDIDALGDACRKLFYAKEKPFAVAMAEFDVALTNGINPRVRQMIEFLKRRDSGRHGRWQETQRKS